MARGGRGRRSSPASRIVTFGCPPAGGEAPPWGAGPPPWAAWGLLFGNLLGRARRARRGDVRAGILVLLAEQPRNGYQIMQEM
jgi:hypothetical protein